MGYNNITSEYVVSLSPENPQGPPGRLGGCRRSHHPLDGALLRTGLAGISLFGFELRNPCVAGRHMV